MTKWDVTANVRNDKFGIFTIVVSKHGKPAIDVSFFRNIPSRITSMTYADPFGDSTATIEFPQVTPFDDINSPGMWWLKPWTNFDIFWTPATKTKKSTSDVQCINPLTDQKDLWLNFYDKESLWEGFSVSIEPSDKGMTIQLQGALFQLDRYIAFPMYSTRPVAAEVLMRRQFNNTIRPLYTQPLRVDYPCKTCPGGVLNPAVHNYDTHIGWRKRFVFPPPTTDVEDKSGMYTAFLPIGLEEGSPWTGIATRNTGSMDSRALTGFCQGLLGMLYLEPTSARGYNYGDQWTITKEAGRKPVLFVRDTTRDHDFELQYGLPGVEMRFTYDGLTSTNVIYGEGTSEDGTPWTNSSVDQRGFTSFQPLASDPTIYPYTSTVNTKAFASETFYNMGSGVNYDMGTNVAKMMLGRDGYPGWLGDITIKVDPTYGLSKWKIRPGMIVLVKGYMGITPGIKMHIAEVVMNPQEGSVTMKVDSKFRDLLAIEQVRASVRDTLTPAKMLQVNKRQFLIDDILRPWNYSLGSGYVPTLAIKNFKRKAADEKFPYRDMLKNFPPHLAPQRYVPINGHVEDTKGRWTIFSVLFSSSFTIRKSEFVICDKFGNILPVPFHVSIYTKHVQVGNMPHTGNDYSPFHADHFESVAPNGLPWPAGEFNSPDPSFKIGWGNATSKGGYWPTYNAYATGQLVDEAPWSHDFAGDDNPNNMHQYDPKQHFESMSRCNLWVAVYANSPVDYPYKMFLTGRFYNKVQE